VNFDVSSFKKNYLSFLIRKTSESYKKLGDDEVVGFIMYWSEKERKKPGILRRKGESIEKVVLAFYPVLLEAYSSGSAILIDPLRRGKLTLTYDVPDEKAVDSALVELASSSGKSFLDILVKIDKLSEDIAGSRGHVIRRSVELENVVSDSSFINDLKLFLNHTTDYGLPFVEIPWISVDCTKVAENVKLVLNEISNSISYVSNVSGKINDLLSNWKKSVQKEYEVKITELDQKIKETREIVMKNIEELRKKKDEELALIRGRYQPHIEAVEKRIAETQENMKKLEEEIERAKSYGRDVSDLKKKLSELKKTLENLEKELSDERANYENEVKRAEKKFEELTEAENNKVKSLLQEKEALRNELESLTREADRRSDKIRSNLQEYREKLIKVEKEIEKISLSIPSSGVGLYMIPVAYTSYVSDGSRRSVIITPVVLEPGGWLGPKLSPVIVEGLRNYLSWSRELIEKTEMKSELEAKNLLVNITLERIELALTRLAEMDLFSRDEVKEIVNSIGEQKKITS